jgi:predicted ArsR family transcriptional regulator
MERTRDEVVRILHERGASSVAELAELVGVSPGSVRRHLDLMIGDGLVEMELIRQPRGRPLTRYSLSEAGEERSAAQYYVRLLDRIYPALARLPSEAVSGKRGEDVLAQVFEAVAHEVAEEYAPRVQAGPLGDRVVAVTAALRDEGILNDAIDEGERYRLRNVGCPYRSTAEGTHAACDADRRTIELLLGQPVEQVTTVVSGARSCEYLVAKLEAGAGAARAGRPEGAAAPATSSTATAPVAPATGGTVATTARGRGALPGGQAGAR